MDSFTDPHPDACGVVELRQYTLHPGRRDALIELFDHEFVETQEAVGIAVIGQFRDLAAADRFVWLRGFRDMAARFAGLSAFYGGPAWLAHRDAANATMIDSDNVLLLHPAWPGSGLAANRRDHAAPGASAPPAGLLDASVFYLREPASDELLALCRQLLAPRLTRGGALRLGWYVSEAAPNNFPRLPVREGEPVLVCLALFQSSAAVEACSAQGDWASEADSRLDRWLARPTERLRLVPTARSAVHA